MRVVGVVDVPPLLLPELPFCGELLMGEFIEGLVDGPSGGFCGVVGAVDDGGTADEFAGLVEFIGPI